MYTRAIDQNLAIIKKTAHPASSEVVKAEPVSDLVLTGCSCKIYLVTKNQDRGTGYLFIW